MTSPPAAVRPVGEVAEETFGGKLTLREHLLELRKRLVFSAIALAITTGGAFMFTSQVLRWLQVPLGGVQLYSLELTTPLVVWFNVALQIGIAAAIPFVLLQVVEFISPALHPKQRVFVFAMLPAALVAFAAGVSFAYLVLMPSAFSFLLTFGSDMATPMLTIDKYLQLVTRLLFWVGIVFEIPIAIFTLAKIGILNARMLVKVWKWAIPCAFVAAAVITPTPDPINQLIVAASLMGLYMISILLAYLAQPNRRKRAK